MKAVWFVEILDEMILKDHTIQKSAVVGVVTVTMIIVILGKVMLGGVWWVNLLEGKMIGWRKLAGH